VSGARIEIEYQDEAVLAMLRQLLDKLEDPQPAMAELAQYGVASTRERIESQNADDPIASWAPLTERYLASKRKRASRGADLVLVLHGHLADQLAWQADSRSAEWGSNRVYAAAQQFGRPEINLPARPFLGVTAADKQKILEIFQAWLSEAAP